MNKLFFAMALLFVGMSVNAQHLGSEYRLKKVIPVAGRQGIAIDSNYYYVSDTNEERSAVPKSRNCQPLR